MFSSSSTLLSILNMFSWVFAKSNNVISSIAYCFSFDGWTVLENSDFLIPDETNFRADDL